MGRKKKENLFKQHNSFKKSPLNMDTIVMPNKILVVTFSGFLFSSTKSYIESAVYQLFTDFPAALANEPKLQSL